MASADILGNGTTKADIFGQNGVVTSNTSNEMSRPDVHVVLQGEFLLYPKCKTTYRVSVEHCKITYAPVKCESQSQRLQSFEQINLKDIVGCDSLKGRKKDDVKAYIAFYCYPHRAKIFSKRTVRRRDVVTFAVDKHSTFPENFEIAQQWKTVICCMLNGIKVTSETDLTALQIPRPKRLLVLVNPYSGPGKALQVFQQRVVPILAEAGVHFNMVVTERQYHALEIVRDMKVDHFDGIVIVSGDGLIHEVINGLMGHENWAEAIKIPVGVLPGGSGNALSCNINHIAGEPFQVDHALHATYILAKHKVVPMDLIAVDTCRGRRLYSFLSVAWGMVADVDIESEQYRVLGDARFMVGSLVRIVNRRKYKGKLHFKPIGEYKLPDKKKSSEEMQGGTSVLEEDEPRMSRSASCPVEVKQTWNGECLPSTEADDKNTLTDLEAVKIGVGDDSPSPLGSASNDNVLSGSQDNSTGIPSSNGITGVFKVNTPSLAPLGEPVPSDWVSLDDTFLFVVAVYQKYLAPDFYAAPQSELNDGIIHLGFLREVPRSRMLKILTKAETGEHLDVDGMEYVKVSAFRIEPGNEKGTMTVDGEQVEYGPIQGEVIPGLSRMMAL